MPGPTRRLTIAAATACAALAIVFGTGLSAHAIDPAPSPLAINEIEPDAVGGGSDWVELTNRGTSPLDIGGYALLDDQPGHPFFVIPAGTTVAPGGYAAFDVSTTFGLGAGGDTVNLYAPDRTTLADSYTWTAANATTFGRCPDASGPFTATATAAGTKGAANACTVASQPAQLVTTVKIDEVESNGGTPGDWIELVNAGAAAADISSYRLRDSDVTHNFTIPTPTVLQPGGHTAFDVEPAFGLGSADSAVFLSPDGATTLDSFSWNSHASTTYGRCPDATGYFLATVASTKGEVNSCPSVSAWPGGAAVSTADTANVLGGNLSGLTYEAGATASADVLWAVKNGPSTLYRLVPQGGGWTPDPSNGWGAGKALHYPDGTGDPDAEGITFTSAGSAGGMFVSTERNNSNNGVSRPEILRFDVSGTATSLNATGEWNLTPDLPGLGANLGAEAVAWVPDSYLTANGFVDQRTGAAYTPGSYRSHGDGLFFVGVEQDSTVYAYALDLTGTGFTRVAAIPTGYPAGVMDLEFEPQTGSLWAECDDTCGGRTETLQIAQSGAAKGSFIAAHVYERPVGMGDFNNEGFAIAPASRCVAGQKAVFWSDDSNDDGHALRSGTLSCTTASAGGGSDVPGSGGAAPSGGSSVGAASGAVELPNTGADGVELWLGVSSSAMLLGAGLLVLRLRRLERRSAD